MLKPRRTSAHTAMTMAHSSLLRRAEVDDLRAAQQEHQTNIRASILGVLRAAGRTPVNFLSRVAEARGLWQSDLRRSRAARLRLLTQAKVPQVRRRIARAWTSSISQVEPDDSGLGTIDLFKDTDVRTTSDYAVLVAVAPSAHVGVCDAYPVPIAAGRSYSVAMRARSRTPAVEPTYMSSVMR